MTTKNPKGIAGITTDPWCHRSWWRRKYPKMSNWQKEGPFSGVEPAIEWENTQSALGYQTSDGGDDPGRPYATRYGYRFDF